MILLGAALFVTGLVLDVCWTRWAQLVDENKPNRAAVAAFLTCLPMMWVRIYSDEPLFVLAYAAGAAVGTWLTVRFW